jgi:hypothetical protein
MAKIAGYAICMKKTLELLNRQLVFCVESKEVHRISEFAEQIAKQRNVKESSARARLMDALEKNKPAYGLRWKWANEHDLDRAAGGQS